MRLLLALPFLATTACTLETQYASTISEHQPAEIIPVVYDDGSWQHFLQNLKESNGPVLDYSGNPINNQEKHISIIDYDIGNKDLQQCADAIIRLRAEYLFNLKRYNEIEFHFTSGDLYRYKDYCSGLRPLVRGSNVNFVQTASTAISHNSLRRYLDIIYAYAGTISLAKELQPTNELKTGTVIITPGSPGHCSIIIDEGTNENGKKVYKLAEGYTPAQSIYVLKNPKDGTEWYELNARGTIRTSSFTFKNYKLGVFE